MGKFYGKIGYGIKKEIRPGYWDDEIIERPYTGDITRQFSRNEPSGDVNDDINMSINISIVADPFAFEKSYLMKYVEYSGTLWKITSVEPKYPRLILTIGGVYNGPRAEQTKTT